MKLSIIMPCYNVAHTLERALRSVIMQKINFKYEIIIVDDASVDGTFELAETWRKRIPLNPKGVFNIFQSYIQCPYTDCAQLRDGKLFRCPASAFSDVLNDYLQYPPPEERAVPQFLLSQRDFLDLNSSITAQDVFSFLSSALPFCSYCDMFNMNSHVKWEKSQKRIEEWVDL